MSQGVETAWRIKVKVKDKEIEVVGINPNLVKKWFDEIEKTYFKTWKE